MRRYMLAGGFLALALGGCSRPTRAPNEIVTLGVPAPTASASPLPDIPATAMPTLAAATVTPSPTVITSVATPILTPATPPDDLAQVTTATAALASGSLSVTFTEAQLTELVRPGLEHGTGELTFSGTQVSLRGGQMTIAATASVSGLSAPATLVLTGVVVNGEIVFTTVSAALGPFDLPADSLKALSAGINTAVNAGLRQEAPNVRPTALTIADGTLTITGEILAP